MKRFTLFVFLILVLASAAWTYPQQPGFPTPTGGISGWDDTNKVWRPAAIGATGTLRVESTVTIGTATVTVGAPPTTNSHTSVSVTSTAQDVASLANRRNVLIVNTDDSGVAWVYFDSTTASATTAPPSIPVYPHGWIERELTADKVISIVSSTTAAVVVYQEGD